ncbi:hypothetical protein SeMB42_g06634 [Synchytrium endobioticum]|uniref:Prefoldin, alpha subunit n=1 Tax=Synchytrium endobioticum TaxID=286115 RepID=A0A507CQA7_9FUNG|nr:hypothetical protein SeMB42_g06634 [Synchytrium endobioticum]TPX41325.1 hypothetical protein SeLEV6574_g06161 [Synchytrium endobioticum]
MSDTNGKQEIQLGNVQDGGSSTIDISQLPVHQLQAIRQQMEQEIQHLTNSFAQLRAAQAKFTDCMEVLVPVEGKSGQAILVPLTSSLYVPGEVGDSSTVIVDVGTGYFVEKSIPDARAFYKRKVDFIKTRLSELEVTITDRRNSHAVLIDIIRSKLYALSQDQKERRSASQGGQAIAAS